MEIDKDIFLWTIIMKNVIIIDYVHAANALVRKQLMFWTSTQLGWQNKPVFL